MRVLILAGGLGTRLSEETELKPKPMVEIGGKPILHHIMMHFLHQGYWTFGVAVGYRGDVIKRYFIDQLQMSDHIVVHASEEKVENLGWSPTWKVDIVDTGPKTDTGGRVKRMESVVGGSRFMLTYGDGLADIDYRDLIAHHERSGKLATVTAVHPPSRFGEIVIEGSTVKEFNEKPQTSQAWINGGFMVLEPEVFGYLDEDSGSFETAVLQRLAAQGQLNAYKHEGFWQCMDTLKEKRYLEQLWESGEAPWKNW
jgi:glucose-1-phosphate cytidylyltransferase